jgi:hypothetical protein
MRVRGAHLRVHGFFFATILDAVIVLVLVSSQSMLSGRSFWNPVPKWYSRLESGQPASKCPARFARLPICITFVSCQRPDLLNQTLLAIMDHVTRYEPCLDYELHWVDQATKERVYFASRFRFEKRVLFSRRQGYAYAFRAVFFLCTLPYILIIEEDWIIKHYPFPLISHSIEMIKSAPFNVYGVIIHWQTVVGRFGGPCVKDEFASPYGPGLVWRFITCGYLYTNGPTVYRMENLRRMLEKDKYYSEWGFAQVAKGMNYTLVFPRKPEEKRVPLGGSHAYFTHAGYGRSTNRRDVCQGESYT